MHNYILIWAHVAIGTSGTTPRHTWVCASATVRESRLRLNVPEMNHADAALADARDVESSPSVFAVNGLALEYALLPYTPELEDMLE
jgi:hypothetical protein